MAQAELICLFDKVQKNGSLHNKHIKEMNLIYKKVSILVVSV